MESPGEKKPDVWDLFRHYDELYFRGALVDAAFTVELTSPRTKTTSCFGSCSFGRAGKTITLYKPLLKDRPTADLKNSLLHLMIHAIIFVKHGLTCQSSHGPTFRDWMDAINACSIEDYLRPKRGYCITTTHDFSREKLLGIQIQGNLWKCESCGVTLVRATKLGPPSDSCCIENERKHETCGNDLCYWHNHKMNCGGTYVPGRRGQKMVPKVKLELLTETSKSQEAVQESDSDEVQENSTVARPNAERKFLSQVYCRNARTPGSSSSKKSSKSNMPEDYQKAIDMPAAPQRTLKPKQEFVASKKHELFTMVNCNNAKSLGSCSSKKADDFQKAIVASASPPSTLKRKQTSVASEKHEHISLGSCNNAKSSRSNTSSKADKWHKPEHVQTSSVQPFASQKKPKLEQDLVVSESKADKWHKPEHVQKSSVQPFASQKKPKLEKDFVLSEKYGDFSLGSYSHAKPPRSSTSRNAGSFHKPKGVEKSSVPLAAPLKELKPGLVALEKHGDAKPLGSSTGNKVGKLHNKPECIQKASVLPAAPPRNLKQDLVASQKNELPSSARRSNANVLDNIKAHKQREHEETRKPVARPAAPQSILKQQNKTNSSVKAGKQQHDPEDFQRGFFQPAVSQRKLKQSNPVAPKRPRTRSKTSSSTRKKEYACVSVWANIYESECSSGSDEPLVNKRTERRKRERERSLQLTYSRSKKRSASGISSTKAQPAEKEIASQQTQPPEVIIIDAADEVVTQDPRDQSPATAPRVEIVAVSPVDQVMPQTPRGQSQPPAERMEIAIPPADLVMTQTPRGQSQPPAQRMEIAISAADLVMTQTRMDMAIPPAYLAMTGTHRDPSVPSKCMDIVAVPPADQMMTLALVDQSQPPVASAVATAQVVPSHSADPPSSAPNSSSYPDVIHISDSDDD